MTVVAASEMQWDEGCWTRDYWLRHCEGYAVDDSDGRIGYVEEVVWAPDGSEPVALKIRGGIGLDCHTLVLPLEHVRELHPSEERIVVDDAGTPDAP